VTVRNVILKHDPDVLAGLAELFESVSLVDGVLGATPSYRAMDFTTRDGYRHAIEELARGSRRSELDVARAAALHAERAGAGEAGAPHDARHHDVGYYLVGNGARPSSSRSLPRSPDATVAAGFVGAAVPAYLGTIAVLTGCLLAVLLVRTAASGVGPAILPSCSVSGARSCLRPGDRAGESRSRDPPSAERPAAARLARGRAVHAADPRRRPDPAHGSRSGRGTDRRAGGALPVDPDGDLRFAILSDWTDAPRMHAGDDDTLAAAREAVARLNRHHGGALGGSDRFLLFHRRRLWNAGERTWMGWERKRGKLHELNRLLRGATDTSFAPVDGASAGVRPTSVTS